MVTKALKKNIKRGGSVVTLSSVSGVLGEPNRNAYVASKHAAIGLTKCLAIDFAEKQIRVNSVAPGVIRTPLTEDYYSNPALLSKINKNYILNRTGDASDVSDVVSFLLSKKASFITGTTMFVDGGWSSFKDI